MTSAPIVLPVPGGPKKRTVTPALEKVFAAEGVGLIGLEAGARYLANELAAPGPVDPFPALALGLDAPARRFCESEISRPRGDTP